REAGPDERDVRLELQEVRDGTDVVLMAVREDDTDDVVEACLDGFEVRQDQVDARLVLLGEEHTAVDDEQLAAVLENRHVAPDLAEAAERRDPQRALGERRRILEGVVDHRVVPCTLGSAPPAAAFRSGLKFEKSAPGTSVTSASSSSMIAASHSSGPTRGRRTRGLEMRPRPCRMYFTDTVPGTWVITARTSGSRRLCSAVAAVRSPRFTASTIVRYGVAVMFPVTPIKP